MKFLFFRFGLKESIVAEWKFNFFYFLIFHIVQSLHAMFERIMMPCFTTDISSCNCNIKSLIKHDEILFFSVWIELFIVTEWKFIVFYFLILDIVQSLHELIERIIMPCSTFHFFGLDWKSLLPKEFFFLLFDIWYFS